MNCSLSNKQQFSSQASSPTSSQTGQSTTKTPSNNLILPQSRVAIVTGGTSGIGLEIVKYLLGEGYLVHVPVRSLARAHHVFRFRSAEWIERLFIYSCDLSSTTQVRQFIDEFKLQQRSQPLDLLINNAGNYLPTISHHVESGVEPHLAVHVIAPFLLVNGLVDLLKLSADGRIIMVNSSAHSLLLSSPLRKCLSMPRDEDTEDDYDGNKHNYSPNSPNQPIHDQFLPLQWENSRVGGYCQAKYLQLLLTWELRQKFYSRLTVLAVNPGLVCTKIGRNDWGLYQLQKFMANWFLPGAMKSPREGAISVLWGALSKEFGIPYSNKDEKNENQTLMIGGERGDEEPLSWTLEHDIKLRRGKILMEALELV